MSHTHSHWSRRDFLRFSTALGMGNIIAPILAQGLQAAVPSQPGSVRWDRQVILVELDGGNDGLNTVVPFENPLYYQHRPKLSIPSRDLNIWAGLDNDNLQYGLHPELAPFERMWKDGDLAIHQGLGYLDSNRSHFRGIDIWNSGSHTNQFLFDGWYARMADGETPPADVVADGLLLSKYSSNPLRMDGARVLGMQDPREFVKDSELITAIPPNTGNASLDHILATQNLILDASSTIDAALGQQPHSSLDRSTFPENSLFADQMFHAADIMKSGLCFPVYKVSLGGFDTHAEQDERHHLLLAELAQTIAAYRNSLTASQWDNTLIVTYSEFGRRVKENGSMGTDHGSAAPHFICGGLVRGGMYGANPDLSESALQANRGDVGWTDDYRRLYATIGSFLGFNEARIDTALGAHYSPLPCL